VEKIFYTQMLRDRNSSVTYIGCIGNSNATGVMILKESSCFTNVNIIHEDVRKKAITLLVMRLF